MKDGGRAGKWKQLRMKAFRSASVCIIDNYWSLKIILALAFRS